MGKREDPLSDWAKLPPSDDFALGLINVQICYMSGMDKKALRTDIRISAFYSQLFHQPPKPSPLLINKKFWYNLNDFELNTTNHSVTRCCCYGISTIVHANPSPYGSKGITCLPRISDSKERKSFCQAPRKLEFPETFSSHSPQKADFFFQENKNEQSLLGQLPPSFFFLGFFQYSQQVLTE